MRIDILTLFPDTLSAILHESIIGRAVNKGILEINCVQIRDFTENRQNQVDDYPYGGGWGCVMMAQPLKSCLDHVMNEAKADSRNQRSRVIYLSPQGKPYNQETAKRLKNDYDHLVLVCGHYEGVDERFIEKCVDEEISLGDFVMTGGEIAALAITDSVCRLVPGVLSDEECYTGESHWDGLLEYPQYTRPEVWEEMPVPEILLNGNHAKIEAWRRKEQFRRTMEKRPDMFERLELHGKEDEKLLAELKKEQGRIKLDKPLSFRMAQKSDLPQIIEITAEARELLKSRKIDQWQGTYPQEENFIADIENDECYIIEHGDETCAFFTLSRKPETSYDDISDGKWGSDAEYCVLHRAAVSKEYLGTGVSRYMIKCVEAVARDYGVHCIRTDTHKKNRAMQRLLRDSGFRYRGNILISSEPGHDPARQAYEKLLKKQIKEVTT